MITMRGTTALLRGIWPGCWVVTAATAPPCLLLLAAASAAASLRGYGYGAGIRVDSPLGPVRLEYAWNDTRSGRFHVALGYD